MTTSIHSMVFFGECMVEHRADGTSYFGGDTFNTAWYLVSLLNAVGLSKPKIKYATAIGQDAQSQQFQTLLAHMGIGCDLVVTHQYKTMGKYWIKLTQNGERSFEFEREQSAARAYFKSHEPLSEALNAKSIDAIYLSGISLAILCSEQLTYLLELLKRFKAQGGIVIFDNNYRASLWHGRKPQSAYLALMALANIAFLTLEDELAIYAKHTLDEVLTVYQNTNEQLVIIRRGPLPCVIKPSNSHELLYVAPEQLHAQSIVDTCAAGDAFAAGFLAQWLVRDLLAHDAIERAAQFAHKVAAEVIQHHGALITPHLLPSLLGEEVSGA
ncbi:2-dehydro-3-deoxygluconokinase [Pseudoalteromonas sp. A25]|uniref:sugar kinase n=1 Tax=Pseudoalteromonas sp. A25 TaxID=116092 RepID=UPI0012605B09|nr:sugar kinase [Pseudoalteromonas sp. A25]BBN81194.1 2-dehydro-3-deoxygluconokinase [Pseudoalteromonas sp. A25]